MPPVPLSPAADRRAAVLDAFARQAGWCHGPSPFTARLLERSRSWLAATPAALDALAAVAADPLAAAVPLRWAGALHHLALQGHEPWASLWPRAGRNGGGPGREGREGSREGRDAAGLDQAIAAAWRTRREALAEALAQPPQTNEVQRSAALLPGLLHIAAATGRPLVLLEIGASAGLNLWCERYGHDHGAWQWRGAPGTPLTLAAQWSGPVPACAASLLVVSRRAACDARPVDLRSPAEALRLASCIWPDQFERLRRLNTAAAAATAWMRDDGVAVQRLAASEFVGRELGAGRRSGCTTVLMHSVLWQYLDAAEQARIRSLVFAAGAAATPEAPLAWLRLEPPTPEMRVELRCRLWDGRGSRGERAGAAPAAGRERLLARAHPHGASIEWIDRDDDDGEAAAAFQAAKGPAA